MVVAGDESIAAGVEDHQPGSLAAATVRFEELAQPGQVRIQG